MTGSSSRALKPVLKTLWWRACRCTRPANIKPFSLPQKDFQEPQDVSDIFDDAPARSREAQELDALFQQPYYGIGQLYAGHKELSYLDLDAGRVGITLADGYISVLPGDPALLSRKLQ